MTLQQFELQPFTSKKLLHDIQVIGGVQRLNHQFSIHFELLDPLNVVEIPSSTDPVRTFGLWNATCFEFFVHPQQSHYWEFNLSPSGQWNVFRFDDYRHGLQNELAWGELPFTVQRHPGVVTVDLTLDLSAIIPADQRLDLAIATVLQSKSGEISYWALTHCAPQADFHQRESFIIHL